MTHEKLRNLPDEVHRVLRQHGHSTEGEVRLSSLRGKPRPGDGAWIASRYIWGVL